MELEGLEGLNGGRWLGVFDLRSQHFPSVATAEDVPAVAVATPASEVAALLLLLLLLVVSLPPLLLTGLAQKQNHRAETCTCNHAHAAGGSGDATTQEAA